MSPTTRPGTSPSAPLLDNVVWHALAGPHRTRSVGTDDARRYAPGFSPIAGFVDPEHPNLAALTRYCEPGEHVYCDGWSGPIPDGWRIHMESTMFKMIWDGGLPEAHDGLEMIPLGPEHATQALDLAVLTNPGPFGPRTIELGEYLGVFDGPRLLAMAGERLCAGTLREISGVCTHPEFQGRGFARALMTLLIRRQLQRGETPFLHVVRTNVGARQLYERMGFRNYLESVVRVISLG